jgi:hypothetical protein
MKLTSLLATASLAGVTLFATALALGLVTPLLFLLPLGALFALTVSADYAARPRFLGGTHAVGAAREAHALAA